ncbi:MAG TPA: methyltransferase MtaB domain-containing protein [Candidatus Bathyarchaeia archaeon]|nr:methyltransferase MtaB domain-containing protein [Candidatus Bathyarchaeia archaeon]
MNRYDQMELESVNELVFGRAKYPLRYGLDLEIGKGSVVPELKFSPRPGKEKDLPTLLKEYENITNDIMDRAVNLGLPAIQLETEHVVQITSNKGWASEITRLQKEILEKYHSEYGIKCALRQTIADIRKAESGLRKGDELTKMWEAFEASAENGADVLSIESLGGKDVFDYAVTRQDVAGVLFSVGVLGSMDMDFLWKEIVNISTHHKVVPGGDTDCSQSNTAMMLAGGLLNNELPHSFAAIIRAAGAARSLVAFEQGALGPDKDCGYEGTILKAISGRPISQEGKGSACAHSSLMGNVAAVACDLWSNEAVQYGDMFGGTTPQVFAEILGYDAAFLNVCLKSGQELAVRDMLALSDKYRDPQALVLTPENAYRLGKVIVTNSNDLFMRAREAMREAAMILEEEKENLALQDIELKALRKSAAELTSYQEGSKFVEDSIKRYRKLVPSFDPSNYDL